MPDEFAREVVRGGLARGAIEKLLHYNLAATMLGGLEITLAED